MSKTNFVLIDFESVQPKDLQLLVNRSCNIKVFVGANQTKVSVDLVLAIQQFELNCEFIQIDGTGNNALDFHIAYYIGHLAKADAFFHIISKDKGFDPLIKHLHKKKIHCHRSTTVADIPLLKSEKQNESAELKLAVKVIPSKAAKKTTQKNNVDSVIQKLVNLKASKPKTLKKLGSTIKAHFSNNISADDLNHVINILTQAKHIKVVDGKVSYTLPS